MKPRLWLIIALFPMAVLSAALLLERVRWASLGGDWHRSGLSRYVGPTSGCVLWRFDAEGAVVGSMTISSSGGIYVSCEDGKLYALNSSGDLLWVFGADTPLLSAPSVAADGRLYVGGRDGTLYALDSSGAVRWASDVGGAIYSSPAIVSTGEVYVGSMDGALHALGRAGEELWQFTTDGVGELSAGAVLASPAVGQDGTVYIGGLYDPNLYALDPADGSVRWVCHFPSAAGEEGGWPLASPVIGPDGTIYQTLLYDSRLYAIEPSAGAIRWSTDLLDLSAVGVSSNDVGSGGDGWSEPVVGLTGTIYVSLDDPYLRAVNPNGTIKWATRLGDTGAFTLTVDEDGMIYAASDDGYVYVVDSLGEEQARFPLGGWPAFPIIAAEDLLIVADSRDYSSLNEPSFNEVWAITSQCPGSGGSGQGSGTKRR